MRDLAKQTIWVSIIYLLAFFFTFLVIFPLQDRFIHLEAEWVSLIFLPHGVRVLTAWLYGGRSLVLLLPSSLITHIYIFGASGFEPKLFIANFIGVVSGFVAFEFVRTIGLNAYPDSGNTLNWRKIFIVGALASVINSLGALVFYQDMLASGNAVNFIFGYLIGDVVGLFVAMFVLMMVFRQIRLSSRFA